MFWLRADMETDTGALRYIADERQQPLELWRLGDGYMVAEGGNLVANTLKGVAVPTSVDNKATCNGIALGLVADKFDVHIFRVLFFVAVLVVYTDQ